MYYFGYCTFLSSTEKEKYMPGSEVVTLGIAKNHKIKFCGTESRVDRGWCHIDDTVEAQGEETIGLVIKHDPKFFVEYPDFERFFLTIHGEDGKTYDCWTLRMTNPTGEIKPPKDYWKLVENGMLYQNLGEEYIDKIRHTYESSLNCQSED